MLFVLHLSLSLSTPCHMQPDFSGVLALARPEALCLVVSDTIHLVASTQTTNALATVFEFGEYERIGCLGNSV